MFTVFIAHVMLSFHVIVYSFKLINLLLLTVFIVHTPVMLTVFNVLYSVVYTFLCS